MASTNRLSSCPSANTTLNNVPSTTLDLLQRFHLAVKNLERSHADDIESLRAQIKRLQEDNARLRAFQEQHPHAAFSIDHVSTDSSSSDIQLQNQLDTARTQIKTLHEALNQKCSDYEDLKSKYQLQRLMNENVQSTSTNDSNSSTRVKELENQLKQIKNQVQQFLLSHDESDEQIRVLKQLVTSNPSQTPNRTPITGLTVKQSDLFQQTTIVEGILIKQHEQILSKIVELLGSAGPDQHPTLNLANGAKKLKKKRL